MIKSEFTWYSLISAILVFFTAYHLLNITPIFIPVLLFCSGISLIGLNVLRFCHLIR